jgi:ribosomal protein S18 acetylase RimI-like enzyme
MSQRLTITFYVLKQVMTSSAIFGTNSSIMGKLFFILDFVVLEAFRSKGYGTAALTALEEHLAKSDAKQIKLRVAYHNKRALALYENLGFTITGYNMAKTLKKSSVD